MDFGILAGDSDKTIYVMLRDSATGLGRTGLSYNSAGATCSYVLPGAARQAIALASQTAEGAHVDGGFAEIDAANCPGLYRLDPPDDAIASGPYSIITIAFDGVIEEAVLIQLHTPQVNVVAVAGEPQSAVDLGDVVAAILALAVMHLDAAVSSRSNHSPADVNTELSGSHGAGAWGTADLTALTALAQTSVDRLTAERATNLDNLDAAVSSRSSHSPADVDTELSGSHGAGSWETGEGGSGTGARTLTITIDDGSDPLQNARVRLSEGANTYIAVTDADGECVFNVDDATYTVAVTKVGYTFAGATLVVSASASQTYSLTAIVVPPPVTADRATGSIRVYNEEGEPESGVSVSVQIQQGPGDAGHGYDTTVWTEQSDNNGDVYFAGLVRGATYVIYRGTSARRAKTFIVPDEDTFSIDELLGAP